MQGSFRCFVTGATGFVGLHLVRALVQRGCETHVLVRHSSACKPLEGLGELLTVHETDGKTQSLVNVLRNSRPELVFHLAALFVAEHTLDEVEPLIESNVLLTAQLLEAMAQASAGALVNTGTAWQHYRGDSYEPVCLYAATKQAAEDLITFYRSAVGLRSVTLKLFDTYGPQDPRKKLFDAFNRATKEENSIAFSEGKQLIDLVYIDDVIDAYLRAASECLRLPHGGTSTFGVASGAPRTIREIAELYSRLVGKPLNIRWGARPYRKHEVMIPWQTYPRLPGWVPLIDLEAGIRRIASSKP